MSLNNSGEFNRYILSNGSNVPSVPQNTPACSSFSDRMLVQMNLKNIKAPEGISLSEKDAVLRNLSNRLLSLTEEQPTTLTDNKKTLTREEAMLELQRTRLGYLVTHLERINLIESEREAEMNAITTLQEKLISGAHVSFGASGPMVEEGALQDFWPTVLEKVALPCVGESESKLFGFVANVTAEYLPANTEGLKAILARTCDECEKNSEWPTCEGIPGNYGNGVRITFHIRHNNIITCPTNRLSIEIRYDIEVPSVVSHIVCSTFSRIDGSSSVVVPNQDEEVPDLNLLELMEVFSKGIDVSSVDEESEANAYFYQTAAEQLSAFCDSIKARVIPYASQIYFGTLAGDADKEDEEDDGSDDN